MVDTAKERGGLRRRFRFWGKSMIHGGRRFYVLLGIVLLLVGGSVFTYLQVASHAQIGVVAAIVTVGVLMVFAEGAFESWSQVETELAGFKATPRPELVIGELPTRYRRVPITEPDGTFVEFGHFFGVDVINTGEAQANNVWAQVTFLSPADGTRLRPSMRGRWASNEQPDAMNQPVSSSHPRFTRTDIPPNEEPAPLDLFVAFSDWPELAVYAYDNENHMRLGRATGYRLEAPNRCFLIEIEVKGNDGVRLRYLVRVQALFTGPFEAQMWPLPPLPEVGL